MEVGEILVDIFRGENKSLFLKRERAFCFWDEKRLKRGKRYKNITVPFYEN